MKMDLDEFLLWYKSGPKNESFNWFNINTDAIKNRSDKDLLGLMATLKLNCRGYGIIAELCKRFNGN